MGQIPRAEYRDTVDENGKVTAVAEGIAKITVTTVDGKKTAVCAVTVTAKSSGGGATGGGSSSGGGGGGSSSSSKPSTSTGTTTRPDGTKVQTETRADGTKIQTETKKDGSTVKTTTNPNGSSVTETKAADGSTGTVKTDKNGNTEAETKVSAKAVEDAKKNGEAVKAPVEVEATRNSNTAPVVKVELPGNSGEAKVEIPVSNVKPGTVAVLVHADGTEEIDVYKRQGCTQTDTRDTTSCRATSVWWAAGHMQGENLMRLCKRCPRRCKRTRRQRLANAIAPDFSSWSRRLQS